MYYGTIIVEHQAYNSGSCKDIDSMLALLAHWVLKEFNLKLDLTYDDRSGVIYDKNTKADYGVLYEKPFGG